MSYPQGSANQQYGAPAPQHHGQGAQQRGPFSITPPESILAVTAVGAFVALVAGTLLAINVTGDKQRVVWIVMGLVGLFMFTGSFCTLCGLRARAAQDRQRNAAGLR